ncbi:putative mitochondrial protein AtMg00310 [Primulina tabacum]|uniref:putative mitochondrial protein AtMg00310 n=1 Tax=Primulina tabacum TaxID=48773 RepID=UPI003F5A53DA
METGAHVKECLSTYEKASGQLVNYDKSALSFSPNTHISLMDTIKNILTIPVVHQHDLYLGLPTFSLRSKRLQFKYLKDRVIQRIQGWGNKWFSSGGKEILIKSILQAIPIFAMSCFKIPTWICEDIEQECANFWWGVENGKRKLHWKTWDFLSQAKSKGGLGFRKLAEFNRALLANQLWRLIQYPDSLAGRVLKGRYFRHGPILQASLGNNPSYIWRSILWSRDILVKGLIWRVGDGKSINIFKDR